MASSSAEALQRLIEIITIIARYGTIVGVNVVQPNYKASRWTFFMMALNILLVFSSLYTMISFDLKTAWLSSNIMGILLQVKYLCFCIINSYYLNIVENVLQGLIKFYVLMTRSEQIHAKVQFLKRVYKSNMSSSSPNFLTLRKWSRQGAIFAKYGIGLIGSTAAIFVGWAAVSTLWTGEKELILYLLLPGVDHTEWFGYGLICGFHLISLTLGTFGTCNSDFMLIIFVFHLWPLGDILNNMCSELNEVLLVESQRNTLELRKFFYNLVQTHQEICEYLEDLSRMYFPMVFVECYTCVFALCTLLYCLFTVGRTT